MKPEDSLEALKAHAASRSVDLQAGSLSKAIETILQFYADCSAADLTAEDGDMLLFQYGCYDWGKGEWFEFDVTRQFISALEEDDDAISQLQVTFRYPPDDALRGLVPFNQWCRSPRELAGFRETIFSSPAFALVTNRKAHEVDVHWGPI